MARENKKPEFDRIMMGINPFINGLSIAINKKRVDVTNKFGDKDVLETDWEATSYTKVFMVEAAKVQVSELPIRSKELYLFIIHALQPATDYLWIDKKAYMLLMGIKSVNTFKMGLKGLFDGLYIYPHATHKDVYWINPHFFFKGSRINKYKNNLLFKAKK